MSNCEIFIHEFRIVYVEVFQEQPETILALRN